MAKTISREQVDVAIDARKAIIRRSMLETIARVEKNLVELREKLEQGEGPHILNESTLLDDLRRIGEKIAAYDEIGYIASHLR